MKSDERLVEFRERGSQRSALISIDLDRKSEYPISRYLTGKFCEHLGSNIYNGMDAQILRNHTFASFRFSSGQKPPDGGTSFLSDPGSIREAIRHHAEGSNWPAPDVESLTVGYEAGLAFWWIREPALADTRYEVGEVVVSPDTGPAGQRAQRIETTGGGIAQWVYLPLHRSHSYEVELLVRSAEIPSGLLFSIYASDRSEAVAQCLIGEPGSEWRTLKGSLDVPSDLDPDLLYRVTITSDGPSNFVIARASLWPADHVGGADPDVIRFLRDSNLPLLRWPGGNFVSSYRWEDGIGPVDMRPTKANPAWGGVEPNTFGTDEFVAFCRAVGCDPMICINAGTGTPKEAALWVEYCNGSVETPMGRLRSENGHAEPYEIRHWEIGNELAAHHQSNWSTPAGYADRFPRFAAAMSAVDPSIELYANGAQTGQGDPWNVALFPLLTTHPAVLTDHPLMGSELSPETNPLDVYRDFMSFPLFFEDRFSRYETMMRNAGVADPHIAITELQLFAHLEQVARNAAGSNDRASLTLKTLVSPPTLAEALYETLYYHMAVRSAPLVQVITHSATVNHGGGLRKEREYVYANPCYYARSMFSRLAGATPVGVRIETAFYENPLVLEDLRDLGHVRPTPHLDAIAALDVERASLIVSIVYRGWESPVELKVEWPADQGRPADMNATLIELTGDLPWATNDRQHPERIVPSERSVDIEEDHMSVTISPFTLLQIVVPWVL